MNPSYAFKRSYCYVGFNVVTSYLKLAFMDRPPLRAPSTPGPSGRIFGKESTDRGRMLSDNCDSHQATAWGSEYLRRLGNHVELTTAFLDEG